MSCLGLEDWSWEDSDPRARVDCIGQILPAAIMELGMGWGRQERQSRDRQHSKREAEELARGGCGTQGTGKMVSAWGDQPGHNHI